ncbi:SMP-30/gluconolactonase/LRE family protein, partial [bacterium]|nr:SMP-30/gluconolactonase/LRE family protein [bacterium]
MKSAFFLLSLIFICFSVQSEDSLPKIIRLDSRFDEIVPSNAIIEKVADGFSWVEGPVWNHVENSLLFSDVPNNSIFRWKANEGTSLFLKSSGYTGTKTFEGKEPGSNGLTFDASGRLVVCQHGDRRIIRIEKDGSKTTLVDRYNG